jgi:hypothetical protein
MGVKVNTAFESQVMRNARIKLGKAANVVRNNATRKLKRGRRGSIGDVRNISGIGEPPHVGISGQLSQSVFWQFKDENTAEIGTPLKVGRWQEQGVPSITPKSGSRLTIPVSAEAQRFMMAPGASVRNFPRKLSPIVSAKTGAILLVEDIGGTKARVKRYTAIHFILVTHSHIPPHPWLRPALMESQAEIQAIFSAPDASAGSTP